MGQSGRGAGSCLGLVALAMASTSIILISYHLHLRLVTDIKDEITNGAHHQDRHRPHAPKKKVIKKVRFADDVVEPSSNNEEYRRRVWSSATINASSMAAAAVGDDQRLLALRSPTHATRRRNIVLPEPDVCRLQQRA